MDISDSLTIATTSLWLPLAVVVGFLAHRRGRFGYVWFLLSVFATPYLAGPVLLVLPRQNAAIATAELDRPAEPQFASGRRRELSRLHRGCGSPSSPSQPSWPRSGA